MVNTGELVKFVADIFLAGAVIGCSYLLIAAVVVVAFKRRAAAPTAAPVPVTLLVPLCGGEPDLARRLTALSGQDYAGPIQIVCGVHDSSDPALEAVRAVAATEPRHTIEWHAEERLHGRNLKVSNLINMAQHARHDTFLMVDSDTEVAPNFVSCMVGALQRPGVGAVTCLFHGVAAGGLWARLAALRINASFLPNVMVALTFGLAQPCFGVGIALTRETLRRIGGLHAFADRLWEDYAIGEAVRGLGDAVVVPPFALGHVFADGSARDFFASELRAARTIKSLDPHGHAGSIITHPFALALIAASLGAGASAMVVALTALVCRIAVCRGIENRFGAEATSYLLLPLRELCSFAVYVASYCGSTVTWRGQRYRLSRRSLVGEPIGDPVADPLTDPG
jgi:ceramide glucosyltransferase